MPPGHGADDLAPLVDAVHDRLAPAARDGALLNSTDLAALGSDDATVYRA